MKLDHLVRIPFFAVAVLAAACHASDEHPIVNGTYAVTNPDPGSVDTITVDNPTICFRLHWREGEVLEKTYEYSVSPDGRIMPGPMRSAEYEPGILKWDWYWDGEAIVQTDPKSKASPRSFSRLGTPP